MSIWDICTNDPNLLIDFVNMTIIPYYLATRPSVGLTQISPNSTYMYIPTYLVDEIS